MSRFVILNYIVEGESRGFGSSNETTVPIEVNVDEVRYFHPRKYGRPGTRLSFKNGSGLVVADPFPVVQTAFDTGRTNHDFAPRALAAPQEMTGQFDSDEQAPPRGHEAPDDDGEELGEDQ